MSPRTWLERIEDILICAHNIRDFTTGMSLHDFLDDPRTSHAVAFEFTTLGEAARAMPTDVREHYPLLPWDKMQAIRNVLVHEYFRIDEEILWMASQEDIPPLIAVLEEILRQNPTDKKR
jgi:uncharacterized protein with HEPN domain